MSWAKPLERVFELDLEHCPNCGGELKIIAAIVEASVIEKIRAVAVSGLQEQTASRGGASWSLVPLLPATSRATTRLRKSR
jgi:hypothetical protein